MKRNFKNKYFFARHGQNVYQAEHPDLIYFWPDGTPPYELTEQGKEEAKKAGEKLKDTKIDVIFSSDIFRCRETAKTIASIIGYDVEKIIYDTRLRDLNWGDFGGKTKEEYWNFYGCDMLNAFEKAVPNGESWNQCRERLIAIFDEIEEEFDGKNILIVSHGDPTWLMRGYAKDMDNQTLLNQRREMMLNTGDVKEMYE